MSTLPRRNDPNRLMAARERLLRHAANGARIAGMNYGSREASRYGVEIKLLFDQNLVLSPNFRRALIPKFCGFPRKALAVAKAETPPFVEHANVDEILGLNG